MKLSRAKAGAAAGRPKNLRNRRAAAQIKGEDVSY